MKCTSHEIQLEVEFLETALRRSALLRKNEPKKANKEYDKLHKLKKAFRSLPDRGETALKRIASNSDVEVKTLAAASLLAVDESYAIALLEEIAASDVGLQSLTAEMTLREWRKGSIREYWN